MKIVLITACGKAKENKVLPAWRLYKSTRIKHLYRRAKELNIPFYILSAKYGLVFCEDIISPYNEIMDSKKCKKNISQIENILKNYDIIVFYKGGARKEYLECIELICKKLNKNLISFGYANMGDIKKLPEVLEIARKSFKNK